MDRTAINFEVLRIAKELVVNEYTDRRAQLHNQWLIDADQLWRTRRLRLAYPPIPPHPTEQDVLDRARLLLAFLDTAHKAEQPQPAPAPEPKPVTQEIKIETPEVIEEAPSAAPAGGWQTPEEEIEDRKAKRFPAMLKSLWGKDDSKK